MPHSLEEQLRAHAGPPLEDEEGRTGCDRFPWPDSLHADALHGVAGLFVRSLEPQSEADPAALLVSFLTAAGCLLGSKAHMTVEADQHPARLFAVLVGDTAKARKGTSFGHVRSVVQQADQEWPGLIGGLSSGEGLIHAVRDGRLGTKKGTPVVVDEGVEDKRLLVVEGEFASVLRVGQREGNTLSPIIRTAWDTGDLRTMTKNSPEKATGAHITILGHITGDELAKYLTDIEAGNGFANRFLFVCVRRSKSLPFGGRGSDTSEVVRHLQAAIGFAGDVGRLNWADETRPLWEAAYADLSEGQPGLLGSVSSRGEAQTLRIAVLYALLDRSTLIQPEHLRAALAVWRYCYQSTLHLFGHQSGDPDAEKIHAALVVARREGLSTTQVSVDVFQRNLRAARIQQALKRLVAQGRAVARKTAGEAAGRPPTCWYAAGFTPESLDERNEIDEETRSGAAIDSSNSFTSLADEIRSEFEVQP